MQTEPISPWIVGPLVVGAFVALFWQELRRPLRHSVEPKPVRDVRNLAIGALGSLVVLAIESPLIYPLARLVELRRWGLLGHCGLSLWSESVLALLLMDYTFYIWHILLHRVPFLWRFHAAHHVDLDLDASTALRFHFGELAASVPWRAAQVLLIGLNPMTFSLWQLFFALSVLFHHSNVRIPIAWERWINRIIVTPRMHGIHHSAVAAETNSDYSSGLSLWDYIHGTLRLNVPQHQILIGTPAFRNARSVTLHKVLAMPFARQPEYWRFPDGQVPAPHVNPSPVTRLLA